MAITSVFLRKPDPLVLRRQTAGWLGQAGVWLPCIVAVAVIATESTGTFSAQNTSSYLRPLFERWFGPINDHVWWWGHHIFRKSGHFCGFGLVCLTFVRAWLLTLGRRANLALGSWRLRSCLLAVLSTALVASGDEWHQTFLPSRTGSPWDVLLDTTGAAISCGLLWFFVWKRQTRRKRSPRAA